MTLVISSATPFSIWSQYSLNWPWWVRNIFRKPRAFSTSMCCNFWFHLSCFLLDMSHSSIKWSAVVASQPTVRSSLCISFSLRSIAEGCSCKSSFKPFKLRASCRDRAILMPNTLDSIISDISSVIFAFSANPSIRSAYGFASEFMKSQSMILSFLHSHRQRRSRIPSHVSVKIVSVGPTIFLNLLKWYTSTDVNNFNRRNTIVKRKSQNHTVADHGA
mmetsp:Transcript_96845/g.246262  ORF Transcript_96845/g.246262 Transcript_96845/m.246262 type:complete len:218 (+) Transcript_96845:589-1242(+)